MPIAHKPSTGGGGIPLNSTEIQYVGVTSPTGLGAGLAVTIIEVVSQLEYALCDASPTGRGNRFAGFTAQIIVPGGGGTLIVGRGSLVTPVVEGGLLLIPDQEVFLSLTPGEVTQTPLDPMTYPGAINLRLGVATTATQMILTTDVYTQFGG